MIWIIEPDIIELQKLFIWIWLDFKVKHDMNQCLASTLSRTFPPPFWLQDIDLSNVWISSWNETLAPIWTTSLFYFVQLLNLPSLSYFNPRANSVQRCQEADSGSMHHWWWWTGWRATCSSTVAPLLRWKKSYRGSLVTLESQFSLSFSLQSFIKTTFIIWYFILVIQN